jgi:hypothetical protein
MNTDTDTNMTDTTDTNMTDTTVTVPTVPTVPKAKKAKKTSVTLSNELDNDNGAKRVESNSGRVSLAKILACETVAQRMQLFSDEAKLSASRNSTDADIQRAKENSQRSLVGTVRCCCGMIVAKNETEDAARDRMLYGNGKRHASDFLKLPAVFCKPVSREFAIANCIDADGALASYSKTEREVRVIYAKK